MNLIATNSGPKGALDHFFAPLFYDNILGSFYPKVIYPVFIICVLFSAYLLIVSRFKKHSINPYLGFFILLLSLYAFKNQVYGISEGITGNPRFLFLPISFITALGPLLLLYVYSLIDKKKLRIFRWALMPSIVFFVFYLLLFFASNEKRTTYQLSDFEPVFGHFEQLVCILLSLISCLIGYVFYKNWQEDQPNGKLFEMGNWIKRFLIINFIFFSFWGLILFFNYWVYDLEVATVTYNPLWVAITLLLLWVSAEILNDPKFFLLRNGVNPTSQLSSAVATELEEKLTSLMTSEQLHKDQNLNLAYLAKRLDINSRLLSAFINEQIGCSFYDFINRYRIETVKSMLKDEAFKNLTIEGVANEAGFKSKSSFNAAFKKHTQMTPREYLRKEEIK